MVGATYTSSIIGCDSSTNLSSKGVVVSYTRRTTTSFSGTCLEFNESNSLNCFGESGALGLALSKTQSEFKAVKKTTEGYGYSYADLTSILSYAQPIYTKYELSIVKLGVTKMLGNTPMAGVKTILIHSSGEWISSEMYQPTVKSKQNSLTQNIGIVNAYFRRYMVQSLLGLSTEDNDGKTE